MKPEIESLPLPFLARWGKAITIVMVVLPISYLSLVLGELVPKSLALRFSERIACLTAPPIDFIARASSFLVKALSASSNAVLWILGTKDHEGAAFISVDEVKSLIREGAAKGIFNETEKELIHSVFEFADTPVKAVKIPRTEIHALDVRASLAEVAKSFVESGFSRLAQARRNHPGKRGNWTDYFRQGDDRHRPDRIIFGFSRMSVCQGHRC